MPACKPKGRWSDSQSGHRPGRWGQGPVGGGQEATNPSMYLSHTDVSFPHSLPSPSLKINKLNKKDSFFYCLGQISKAVQQLPNSSQKQKAFHRKKRNHNCNQYTKVMLVINQTQISEYQDGGLTENISTQ